MSDQNLTPELTFGQKAAGVSFNPSKDPSVDKIKGLFAEIIDLCHDEVESLHNGGDKNGDKRYYFNKAIAYAEDAQMNAVKAITWPH
jgi:hypothetical protein